MKTLTFKNAEEKIGDNPLRKNSGLSAVNNQNKDKHVIIQKISFSSIPLTETLSKMKFFYTTPALSNHREPNKGGFTNKNSFMKTFLQKTCFFAIALLIANLFLVNNALGQTTVFTDNFNRAAVSGGGTPTMTYSSTNGSGSNTAISGTAFLQISSSTNGNSGISYTTGPLATYSTPFATTLASNAGIITWSFNMRYNRTTSPNGFSGGNYGIATVLAASSAALTGGTGYAVVYGGGTGTQRYRLVSYNGGLDGNTNLTEIISSTASAPAAINNFVSIRITYDPSTNNWAMFLRDDGNTTWGDPSAGVTTQIGATTANSTFTGTAMTSFGFLWNYGGTNNQSAQFDNFTASVCSFPAQPTVITGLT